MTYTLKLTSCDIKSDLSDLGHFVHNVTNIQIKKKVDPNNKLSDRTIVWLPIFSVDLEPQANIKHIYDIKNVCYYIIKLEPPRKNKEVPQCKIAKYLVTLKTTVSKHQSV